MSQYLRSNGILIEIILVLDRKKKDFKKERKFGTNDITKNSREIAQEKETYLFKWKYTGKL